jgi:hypothetical protein
MTDPLVQQVEPATRLDDSSLRRDCSAIRERIVGACIFGCDGVEILLSVAPRWLHTQAELHEPRLS